MKLPIGYSDFKEIIDNKYDFVDKSLFIKEIIDDSSKIILITRPRRFGKTLNLSMLHYFFAPQVEEISTENLFNGLLITKEYTAFKEYQGKYPVIAITLKDVKDGNFESAYANLKILISEAYQEHYYLLSSPHISDEEKEIFRAILAQNSDMARIQSSLKALSKYLYRHHRTKVVLLMDEYDTPIQSAYMHGYYDEMILLMRQLFGTGLKDNKYLFKAVLTGILRVSRESLFSGLNNLRVYSVLHSKYCEYFGFTQNEVAMLLSKAGLENKTDEIKLWYNGYKIGNQILYNPWSLVNCILERGVMKPYWVNTSDNALIKELLLRSSVAFKEQFELLLEGKIIERIIDENFIFPDLKSNSESAVWSLLVMTGYLKVNSYQETYQGASCQLAIPNYEIRNLYSKIIEKWLANGLGLEWYNQFIQNLLDGDMVEFERGLNNILTQTVSVHDVAREPEAFYHGLMIGLTASLYGNNNYATKSNRESGYGRYDYLIISHNPEKLSILMEFKQLNLTETIKNSDKAVKLKAAAQDALKQIEDRLYTAEIKNVKRNILKIGIAFCGKQFSIAHEKLS